MLVPMPQTLHIQILLGDEKMVMGEMERSQTMMLEKLVNPLVNREAALDRVGGDKELLAEIAQLFLEDYPRIMADIRTALHSNDAAGVEHAAHSLKGSVANFGAEPAWQAAFELERIGRSRDLSEAADAFARLSEIFAVLKPELEALTR